jgi:hypothetical protein
MIKEQNVNNTNDRPSKKVVVLPNKAIGNNEFEIDLDLHLCLVFLKQ